MSAVPCFPAACVSLFGAWLQPRPQMLGLLVGLGIFTVALLVLIFTRWGQARPLAKCIALSVFAHALLLAYAYGLPLFFEVPVPPRSAVIKVTVAEISEEPPSDEPQPSPSQPGEDLATEPAVEPKPAEPERAEVDRAEVLPRPAENPAPPIESPPLLDVPPSVEPPLPAPALADHASQERTPAPEARADAKVPEPQPLAETAPTAPPMREPERLSVEPSEAVPLRTASTEVPSEDPEVNEHTLQHLIDIALPTDTPEAVADSHDEMEATDTTDSPARGPDVPAPQDLPAERTVSGETSRLPMVASIAPEMLPIRRSGDGGELPQPFRGRMTADRELLLAKNGGTPQTEAAVAAALSWLAANQSPDGRWDCSSHGGGREDRVLGHDRGGAGAQADTAVTGLALLSFLGAGHTHLDGDFRTTVGRGLDFLMRSQASDGNLAGQAELFARMYCHGMATLAIGEAYAMTGDARLKPALERAIGYTLRAQHPTSGGWRYQPGDEGDTSQFGWQLMALRSAELGGLPTPAPTRAGMIRFLNSVTTGPQRGLASYRPHTAATRTMTAEALVCRVFLGLKPDSGAANEAVQFMLQETPEVGPINLYYWYYATLALFQMQGEAWETWNAALQQRLLATQATSSTLAGSWPTNTVWGGYGGRVYTTAMAALCLEVYYRHLPVYGNLRN